MSSVKRQVKSLLLDTRAYIRQISDIDYSRRLEVLSGSSIGQHTRHFIEFFQCVMGYEDQRQEQNKAVINYDLRKRDTCIECDTEHVLILLEKLDKAIDLLDVKVEIWLAHTDYESGSINLIPSSIERELFYNIEHTIHHFALIKIGLLHLATQIELPDHFGVAPSTLAYRKTAAALTD